jgi:hypothetical protein
MKLCNKLGSCIEKSINLLFPFNSSSFILIFIFSLHSLFSISVFSIEFQELSVLH